MFKAKTDLGKWIRLKKTGYNRQRSNLLMVGFIFALLLSVGINACGVPQKTELTTLRVGITPRPGFDIAIYGQEAGLFEKRGLDVQLVRFKNQQDSARAMMRGALDAAFTSVWDVMQIDPGNDHPVFVMVSDISDGVDGIVTQPGFYSLKSLSGKRVAAKLGTINHLILLEALQFHKMRPQDVTIEDVSNEIAVELMKEGKIQGAVLWEPLLSRTAKEISGNIVYTTQEVDSLVIDGLVTRSAILADKKDSLTQFIVGWFDIMHAVDINPDKVFKQVSEELGQTTELFDRNYARLKKGDIAMNERLFKYGSPLIQKTRKIIKFLYNDSRHGKIIRKDVEITTEQVNDAIEVWKQEQAIAPVE